MSDAYSKAEAFFMEEWGDEPIRVHSKCVIDCCKNMIIHTSLNPTIFEIAGFLHDIGRKENKERHHEIGLVYLKKFLQKFPEFLSLEKEISDCILNHRRTQTPQTIYGKVIQVADKVSLYHKQWQDYKSRHNP